MSNRATPSPLVLPIFPPTVRMVLEVGFANDWASEDALAPSSRSATERQRSSFFNMGYLSNEGLREAQHTAVTQLSWFQKRATSPLRWTLGEIKHLRLFLLFFYHFIGDKSQIFNMSSEHIHAVDSANFSCLNGGLVCCPGWPPWSGRGDAGTAQTSISIV